MQEIIIYSDGACKGNPGPGGWGALLFYNNLKKELFGGQDNTTNNRMEMLAIIQALLAIPTLKLQVLNEITNQKLYSIELYTDSQYVLKGMTEWLSNWKKRDWKTAANTPVKNIDLWQQLDNLVQLYKINWHWVRGHQGNAGNERADELANLGILEMREKCVK